MEKIADAVKVLELYRGTFHEKKTHLDKYFKDKPVVEWDFPPDFVFSRIDSLMSRLKMIEVNAISYGFRIHNTVLSNLFQIGLQYMSIMYHFALT